MRSGTKASTRSPSAPREPGGLSGNHRTSSLPSGASSISTFGAKNSLAPSDVDQARHTSASDAGTVISRRSGSSPAGAGGSVLAGTRSVALAQWNARISGVKSPAFTAGSSARIRSTSARSDEAKTTIPHERSVAGPPSTTRPSRNSRCMYWPCSPSFAMSGIPELGQLGPCSSSARCRTGSDCAGPRSCEPKETRDATLAHRIGSMVIARRS